ncbi:MAG: hypothetical protein AAF826_05520 [Pseudomonadota bacterium]
MRWVNILWVLSALVLSGAVHASEDLGSFTGPSWQVGDDPMQNSARRVIESRDGEARQLIYQLIPKGQTDQNWRKRHWVFVAEDIRKPILSVRDSYLSRSEAECAVDQKWADWDKSRNETLFAVFCGKRVSDGQGYLSVVWMGKNRRTLVRVSEEWRGAPYTFGQSDTYFWDREALTNLIASMGASELK